MRALAFGVGVAVALLAGATVLLLTSVQLGLLVLVGLPLALWASHRLARPLTRRATEQQETAADAAGVAADLVEGHRVLHGIGGTGAGVARYRAASRASLDATLGAARAEAAYEASALLVAGVALALVALAGGRLAAAGDISIGQLIAAVGVTQFLVGPLSRLAWVGAMVARARGSAERLSAALAAPPAPPKAPRAPARRRRPPGLPSAGCATARSTGSTSTSRPDRCTASPQPTRPAAGRCWTASAARSRPPAARSRSAASSWRRSARRPRAPR